MSEDSSPGDVGVLENGDSAEAPVEPVAEIDQETQFAALELESRETSNETPFELQAVEPGSQKTIIYHPISQGSESLSENPNFLVHEAVDGPILEPLRLKPSAGSLDSPVTPGPYPSYQGEHEGTDAIREFEEKYSQAEQTPTKVVRKIVDYLRYTRYTQKNDAQLVEERNLWITELNEEIEFHKDNVDKLEIEVEDLAEKVEDFKGIGARYNKNWIEVEKQLHANPEMPFSFVSLNKHATRNQDSGDAQSRLGTKEEPTIGVGDMLKGHRRTPSVATMANLLPAARRLEESIVKLKVTNLFGRARDSFQERKFTETLTIANEAISLCHAKCLGKERILLAKALFWKAQAEGELKMLVEAYNDYTDAISLGLGVHSESVEGDQVEEMMINVRLKRDFGRKRTGTGFSGRERGGTPSIKQSQGAKPS